VIPNVIMTRRGTTKCIFALLIVFVYKAPNSSAQEMERKWRILHITDIHLDMQYVEGAEVACAAPPCCRRRTSQDASDFEFSSDNLPEFPARSFGEYTCDSPPQLLQSALDAARQAHPDIVIWGGDTAPHEAAGRKGAPAGATSLGERLDAARARVRASLAAATTLFHTMFPNTPVLPQLGNHDFAMGAMNEAPLGGGWMTQLAADLWKQWLPPSALRTLEWGGYYEHRPVPGLRVAVLNTEVCHIQNMHAFVDGGEAARLQLRWLESVLRGAQNDAETVLVTGHIPPGTWSGCWGNYSAEYEAVVARYAAVVAGQLFGHQHSGSFRMMRSPSHPHINAYGVAFVTPSLAPFLHQNPSFRFYDVAGSPSAIQHFEQYFLNLGSVDPGNQGGPLLWSPGFVPRSALGLSDLSPNAWQGVLNRMWNNETFAIAYRAAEANGRDWMALKGANNGDIRDYLCALTGITDNEYQTCTGKSEEVMIRQYTGSVHTYVLTALFPFHVIMDHFHHVLSGIRPEDWDA